jgi:hypothetical protein
MKHRRRQELKTNELSIYLQQAYEFITRNATYILGGVVVVVLIVVVGMLNARSQHRAELDAVTKCNDLIRGDVVKDPKLLDDAKTLVAEYGSHASLGPVVLELEASLSNRLAVSLVGPSERGRRIELFKQGKAACARAMSEFSKKPEVVARARMTEASLDESLLLEGEGDKETIRKLYQQVIDGPSSPYQSVAKELLASLDERIAKLEIVATRPAETAPAASTRPVSGPRSQPFAEPLKIELPGPKKSGEATPRPPTAPKATPTTKPAAGAKAPTAGKPGTAAKPSAKPAAKPATKPAE